MRHDIRKIKMNTQRLVTLKRTWMSLEVTPDSQPAPPSLMHIRMTSGAWPHLKYEQGSPTSWESPDMSLLSRH